MNTHRRKATRTRPNQSLEGAGHGAVKRTLSVDLGERMHLRKLLRFSMNKERGRLADKDALQTCDGRVQLILAGRYTGMRVIAVDADERRQIHGIELADWRTRT